MVFCFNVKILLRNCLNMVILYIYKMLEYPGYRQFNVVEFWAISLYNFVQICATLVLLFTFAFSQTRKRKLNYKENKFHSLIIYSSSYLPSFLFIFTPIFHSKHSLWDSKQSLEHLRGSNRNTKFLKKLKCQLHQGTILSLEN